MKKILSTILIITMIFSMNIISVFATGGDGNVDGGGGDMGDGSNENVWSVNDEGVRVTVVLAENHNVITTPIDLTNKSPSTDIFNFGKISKLNYTGGRSLSPQQGGFTTYTPEQAIPRIIATGTGGNNIEAIKSYFTDELIIRYIAEITGMDYDVLIGGKYKLLLEPIAYFKYEGVMIATTATEAALYDEQVNGDLRTKMGNFTHKNLPLSMFLEVADLGYPAWSGSTTAITTIANIKSSLGLGIVRFTEQPEEPEEPEISAFDYEYRVNTEVITSVMVSGGQSDPENDTTVTFNIDGSNHVVSNVYYPDGDSQLVWVKWTTPDEPQEMVIPVSSQGQGSVEKSTINVNIVDLDKNPPPNPVADDRNDRFRYSNVPSREEETDANWSVWSPWWLEDWIWESNWQWVGSYENGYMVDLGQWVDGGGWEFICDQYSASLRGDMELLNDPKNPTATRFSFKSGYGINQEVSSKARTNQNSAVTRTPNAVSYFPEFGYETYWRLLERVRSGKNSEFEFQKNNYSTYKNPTHFTPIWMPDGAYKVNTWLIDVWTPVGMLSMNLTDELTVRGSMWDDWHAGPIKP